MKKLLAKFGKNLQRYFSILKINFQRSAFQREIVILVLVVVTLLVLIIVSLFNSLNRKNSTPNLPPNNSTISVSTFTLTNDNGKIIVESRDPNFTDKDAVRKKLQIPDNIDFELIIPGAAGSRDFSNDSTYKPNGQNGPSRNLGD